MADNDSDGTLFGDDTAAAAAQLSRKGASKGGKARAARLSSEERAEAARAAAEARWGRSVVNATHTGEIIIGDRRIDCAVLEDGRRVLSQGTILTALNRAPSMGRRAVTSGGFAAPFLSAANLRPYITPDLLEMAQPVEYRLPGTSAKVTGYPAEILPRVCEVYLDARDQGPLPKSQVAAAEAAYILMRGLARVGIIALVDEATGYQEVRARQELQRILEAYVQAEFRPWLKRFPDEFFAQTYRLQGWEYRPGTSRRTPYIGKLINKYIYDQLPAGVHEELNRVNPMVKGYRRARKHHQHLTADTGNEHLDKQIMQIVTLMKVSRDQHEFEELFERAFPPPQGRLPLVIAVEPEAEQD